MVRETTNKSSNIKPNVGDIVVINTTKDTRNIGQIVAIERPTAKILSQDKIYRQPISYLTPLYTETDNEQDKKAEGNDTDGWTALTHYLKMKKHYMRVLM